METSISLGLWPGNVALLEILRTHEKGIINFAVPFVAGGELGGGEETLELGGGEGTLEREAILDLCCCRNDSGD